ncbi:hypothetical protein H8891_07395 [Paeniclostridium sp. NSJ-45]|uniref:Uncharacterized protein n=1 Tax=Paeniclostridium hominis TaxID=2764329 RepID=A0ABR7K3F0_9FIRM|nr:MULTISPECIES: hypothetical protein [Paeniclostridium]MBC6003622.1 hypothetical protein [Paeniclostridium hominis]
MTTLKILKEENEVMELSIANGLFYILRENDIECSLINKEAAYIIEINGDVDYEEDLLFPEMTKEKITNKNSTMNKSELEKILVKVNQYLNNPNYLGEIFKYYESLDESMLSKDILSKDGALFIGTSTYTKGVRGYSVAGASSLKIPLYKKLISFVGFLMAASYFSIKDVVEVNPILIPKNTDEFIRAEFISYRDKETGDTRHLRMISKKDPKTISLSRLYLLSLKKLAQKTILEGYEGIWLIQVVPTANKPLNDKTIKLPVHNLSIEFIDELLKKVEYSSTDRDAKLALCDYLLNQDFESFSNMICAFSKSQTIMIDKYFEEMIGMRTEKESYIYSNESIRVLGRGLNRLIRDKVGFSIQVNLLSCSNKQQLIEIIRDLNLLYFRKYKSYLLNDKSYIEVLDLVEDTKTLKIVRDSILTFSTIYINSKKYDE